MGFKDRIYSGTAQTIKLGIGGNLSFEEAEAAAKFQVLYLSILHSHLACCRLPPQR